MANEDETGERPVEILTELVLTLRKPIHVTTKLEDDPNPITELKLTEPSADQLSKFVAASIKPGSNDVEAGIVFISNNTGVHMNAIRRMTARDFQTACDFLGGFTNPGPSAGKT